MSDEQDTPEPITHYVLDTETLCKYPSAVVLSIGISPFRFEEKTGFRKLVKRGLYLKLSVRDQVKNWKRTMDDDTIAWWKSQGEAAKIVLTPQPDDLTMEAAMAKIDEFFEQDPHYDYKQSYLWSRGNLFDFGKIEDMYRQLGRKEPYNTYRVRDIRTAVDVMCGVSNGKVKAMDEREGFIHHHALHDAANDAATFQEIYERLSNGED